MRNAMKFNPPQLFQVLVASFLLCTTRVINVNVDAQEPDAAAAQLRGHIPSEMVETPEQLTFQQVFDRLDVNEDHVIDLKDIYKLDQNHDATISKHEFTEALGQGHRKHYNGGDTYETNYDTDETGGFFKGFTSSTAMIIATEIGDKTFFIAAVLSMKHSRFTVFAGAISALICMTILSTLMGLILPSILPRQYTHIIGGLLFLYFGVKLIYDSRSMADKVSDELEEVEEELGVTNKKNDEEDGQEIKATNSNASDKNVPMGIDLSNIIPSSLDKNVLVQGFLLTFLAEWGDRSQIATIALAAAKDPYGVTVGACFGHSLCTGMACVGGRMLASRISEKTVTFWGGIIFLAFGLHAFFFE